MERPTELLDAGHHDDDTTWNQRREFANLQVRDDRLPRDVMLANLTTLGLVNRPAPRGSTTTSN